jgi:hypothetical protein
VEENVHEQAMSVLTIIHCTNALAHPCLVSLLFMASLYSTLL